MPHCTHLNGHCTQTGDHWDHYATYRTYRLAAGRHAEYRLEHWDGTEPILAVFVGDTALELTPRQAAALALRLAATAGPLLRLAARLALARRRARH